MSQQHHIIGRAILELNTGNLADVWSLQEEVSRLFQQQIVPEMEQLFDHLVGIDQVVRLDQLVVDVGSIDRQFLRDEFLPHLLTALNQTLIDILQADTLQADTLPDIVAQNQTVEPSSDRVTSTASRDRAGANGEVLLYFLQYGRLPWWATGDWQHWLSCWENLVQSSSNWQAPLQTLLTTNASARQRLVHQIPEALRYQLIVQMQPSGSHWLTLLTPNPSQDKQSLWQVAIDQMFTRSSVNSSVGASNWVILLYFLQQGQLPSQQDTRDWQAWLSCWATMLQSDTNWRQPLKELLVADVRARQRLVEQFPEAFRHQLIVQMQPLWITWFGRLNEARQVMQGLNLASDVSYTLEKQAWLLLLAELGSENKPLPDSIWIRNWLIQVVQMQQGTIAALEQPLREILTAIVLNEPDIWLTALNQVSLNALDQVATDERQKRNRSTLSSEEETAGLYITQAGLVLLHPFLRFYLEAVGLVEDGVFRDQLAQQRAIYLMYYLATKQTDAPEHELVLPKLLCGWVLDEPVVRGVELPESALEEGEHLLQTVIDYWEALKSTSPDGLREGFLQRQGKLTRTNDGNWKLQVEQQAIDILLGRLPWGLSMVTLPWMEGLLVVEWT